MAATLADVEVPNSRASANARRSARVRTTAAGAARTKLLLDVELEPKVVARSRVETFVDEPRVGDVGRREGCFVFEVPEVDHPFYNIIPIA